VGGGGNVTGCKEEKKIGLDKKSYSLTRNQF
jgi:hypothetical protein